MFLVVVTALSVLLAGPVAAAKAADAGAPGRGAGTRSARAASQALPDSVLARVGGSRTVTRSGFERAWNQLTPPSRPDSLTPESARGFLDLLIGKEILGETALKQTWRWTLQDSARVLGVADRLVMKAMLDSALEATRRERRAAGDAVPDDASLGTLARDSTVARMRPVFDRALVERLAADWAAIPRPSSDSSLYAQLRVLGTLPVVRPEDAGRIVVRVRGDSLGVADLIEAWKRINPVTRPRVSTTDQMEDLIRNVLFERLLRREAARRGIERRPDIAVAVRAQEEYVAVSHLVEREVYATLKPDSASLLRYFHESERLYDLPLRVRVLKLDMGSRSEGMAMALKLRTSAEAETLAARSQRQGLGYVVEVAAAFDSALFARALKAGTGAVLGPDSSSQGWQVVRVAEVLPSRPRRFEEVRVQVETAWYGDEGERRMQDLITRLRARTPVAVNERALARLTHRP